MANITPRPKPPRSSPSRGTPVDPAAERGENRIETGKAIARGGKTSGAVPGATEQSPKSHAEAGSAAGPPGEMPAESVQKVRAVADALVQLGEDADPIRVVEAVKAQTGIAIDPDEVAALRDALRKRADTPPGPDQPPPQEARRVAPDRNPPSAEWETVRPG